MDLARLAKEGRLRTTSASVARSSAAFPRSVVYAMNAGGSALTRGKWTRYYGEAEKTCGPPRLRLPDAAIQSSIRTSLNALTSLALRYQHGNSSSRQLWIRLVRLLDTMASHTKRYTMDAPSSLAFLGKHFTRHVRPVLTLRKSLGRPLTYSSGF